MKYPRSVDGSTSVPSTWTRSFPGSTLVPGSLITSPFTFTRPSAISSSARRRDATPALDRNFCSLSVTLTTLASRHGRRRRRRVEHLGRRLGPLVRRRDRRLQLRQRRLRILVG